MSDKISKIIAEVSKKIEENWKKELGTMTYTTTEKGDTLTYEKLIEVLDEGFSTLYYGTASYVDQGILYHSKKTSISPEFIICNPEDLDQVKNLIRHRRLLHISKYWEENR